MIGGRSYIKMVKLKFLGSCKIMNLATCEFIIVFHMSSNWGVSKDNVVTLEKIFPMLYCMSHLEVNYILFPRFLWFEVKLLI